MLEIWGTLLPGVYGDQKCSVPSLSCFVGLLPGRRNCSNASTSSNSNISSTSQFHYFPFSTVLFWQGNPQICNVSHPSRLGGFFHTLCRWCRHSRGSTAGREVLWSRWSIRIKFWNWSSQGYPLHRAVFVSRVRLRVRKLKVGQRRVMGLGQQGRWLYRDFPFF